MRTLEHRGCTLAYDLRGDGPPVLLIQGVAVHGDGWRPQVDVLAARYHCLSFDNRGYAASRSGVRSASSKWPRMRGP